MTADERWKEIEECFDCIELDIQHRCYAGRSVSGTGYIALLVRRHLARIDLLLLEEMVEAGSNKMSERQRQVRDVEDALDNMIEWWVKADLPSALEAIATAIEETGQ